ncbi:MAG: putative quinol monooxygenase [Pyrinomonadaceae bacterium]
MEAERKIYVMAEVRAAAGFAAEVKAACLALIGPSRLEKGCLSYDLHQAADDPNLFVFFESWASPADLERHLESDHAARFDRETEEMLAEEERITILDRIS